MARIHIFPRYHQHENFVTNNTILLLGRIYQIDRNLFELLLNKILDGGELTVGPSFVQQEGSGGIGIPDAIINQASFKIVVETKLWDKNFWSKEEYVSHFRNETTRVLITISKDGMQEGRISQIKTALENYDTKTNAIGKTVHVDLTFVALLKNLKTVVEETKTRFKIEIEELLEDFEGFLFYFDLISDEHLRMHVFAINDSEEDNTFYKLYYNQAYRNERPHRFVGLYRDKQVKYIAETKVIVIPKMENGELKLTFLKGEKNWTDEMRNRLIDFFENEGWGNDGSMKFHMFDSIYNTSFKKTSAYGIMGPRHFILNDYLENIPNEFNSEWLAEQLEDKTWE
jgi:hypothetical protein